VPNDDIYRGGKKIASITHKAGGENKKSRYQNCIQGSSLEGRALAGLRK
jgi:hypothetical protein